MHFVLPCQYFAFILVDLSFPPLLGTKIKSFNVKLICWVSINNGPNFRDISQVSYLGFCFLYVVFVRPIRTQGRESSMKPCLAINLQKFTNCGQVLAKSFFIGVVTTNLHHITRYNSRYLYNLALYFLFFHNLRRDQNTGNDRRTIHFIIA